MPHLEEIIQRLYDSEINLTITMLWDGDFAFASYMEFHAIGTPVADLQSLVKHRPANITSPPWHNCRSARELAAAIHEAALYKYPQLDYAKTYRCPN